MAVDGDASDLTTNVVIYPEYSGYQTAYGHTDFYGDYDYCNLYLSSSGYFDLGATGAIDVYVYDYTANVWVQDGNTSSYKSGLFLDASHINYLEVYGYTTGETYKVTAAPYSAVDGDESDLTTSDAIYPEYSDYQTAYGHSDYYGDMDYAPMYIWTSGYFDVTSTGSTAAAVYDATAGYWLFGASYMSTLYIDASHTNYVCVLGSNTGETYNVKVSPCTFADGDSSDLTANNVIYPSYSGYQTAYGHTDFSGDYDLGSLYLSSSGYYDLSTTGNIEAYVYDFTEDAWVENSSTSSCKIGLYLDTSHSYGLEVFGYTTGERYSLTVTPGS